MEFYMQSSKKFCLTIVALLLITFSSVKGQGEGQVMPDFQLFGLDGDLIRLSSMKDKYVLINFAQPYCPEYITVQPQLIGLEKKYSSKEFTNADGFEVINISLETDANLVRQVLAKYGGGVKYETMLPQMYDAKVCRDYGVTAPITRFLLGPGNQLIGKDMSFTDIEQLLESNQMVEEVFYRVFLAIFPISSEIFHQYTHVTHLGQIYKEKNNNSSVASYLGTYYDYDDALYARDNAIEAGYQQAQIVTYRNNLIAPSLTNSEWNNTENVQHYTSRSVEEAPVAPKQPDINQPIPDPANNVPTFTPPNSYKAANPAWQKNDSPPPANTKTTQPSSNTESPKDPIIFTPPPNPANSGWQSAPPITTDPILQNSQNREIADLEERLRRIEDRLILINNELQQLLEESRFIREELNRRKTGY